MTHHRTTDHQRPDPDVVVVVPTYDERENLPELVRRVLALDVPRLRLLIVDDGSPDGTGELADDYATAHPGRIHVLHRAGKNGLGRAYVAGLLRAMDLGADIVVQMDADLSHPVEVITTMIDMLGGGDAAVVVGSRYVPGGAVAPEWPVRRRLLSRWANRYVDAVLHLGMTDATSGFKAWRTETLDAIDVASIRSDGYSFQVEMNHRVVRAGLDLTEVPIRFEERSHGASKMTLRVQWESARMPWTLRRLPAPAPCTPTARRAPRSMAGM